jgi:hypothetical protein
MSASPSLAPIGSRERATLALIMDHEGGGPPTTMPSPGSSSVHQQLPLQQQQQQQLLQAPFEQSPKQLAQTATGAVAVPQAAPPPVIQSAQSSVMDPSLQAIGGHSSFSSSEGEIVSMGHAQRLAAQGCARAAWLAPVAALCLAMATLAGREQYPIFRWIIDGVNAVFLLAGLISGLMALVTIRRADRPGVAAPAVAGICISVMLLVLAAAAVAAFRQMWGIKLAAAFDPPSTTTAATAIDPAPRAAATHRTPVAFMASVPATAEKPASSRTRVRTAADDDDDATVPSRSMMLMRHGGGLGGSAISLHDTIACREDVEKCGGWYGAATAGPAVLTIIQLPDEAPPSHRLLAALPFQVCAAYIMVDNTHGSAPVTIDPASLRAEMPSGQKIAALPAASILETVPHPHRDALLARSAHELRAERGQMVCSGLAFFIAGTDFHRVSRFSLVYNGRRVTLAGRYFPPDSRFALVKGDR